MSARRRWSAVVGGCAAVIALAVAITWSTGATRSPAARPASSASTSVVPPTHSTSAAAGPSCPARFNTADNLWVPAPPTGLDGHDRLAPTASPSAAVVCAYRHGDDGALTGARPLGGDLTAVPAALGWAPRQV